MRSARGRQDSTNRWRAAASPGALIGIIGIILLVLMIGGLVAVLTGRAGLPLPTLVVWAILLILIVALAGLAYLLYGYATMSYEFGDRTLTIRWAHQRFVVDLESIDEMRPAIDRMPEQPGRWQQFWPGYYVGNQAHPDGQVTVVATMPVRRQLLVTAGTRRFAISPERPVLFVEEYGRVRRALDAQHTGGHPTVQPGESAQRLADAGWTMQYPSISPRFSTSAVIPGSQKEAAGDSEAGAEGAGTPPSGRTLSPLLRPVLLEDQVSLGLLALAVLMNVVMVVYILTQYEGLPASLVLHWNANGDPDRIGSPREIWTLPIITGLVTIANFVLAWSIVTFDRFAARFLLGATCLVQLVAWVALLTIIP